MTNKDSQNTEQDGIANLSTSEALEEGFGGILGHTLKIVKSLFTLLVGGGSVTAMLLVLTNKFADQYQNAYYDFFHIENTTWKSSNISVQDKLFSDLFFSGFYSLIVILFLFLLLIISGFIIWLWSKRLRHKFFVYILTVVYVVFLVSLPLFGLSFLGNWKAYLDWKFPRSTCYTFNMSNEWVALPQGDLSPNETSELKKELAEKKWVILLPLKNEEYAIYMVKDPNQDKSSPTTQKISKKDIDGYREGEQAIPSGQVQHNNCVPNR